MSTENFEVHPIDTEAELQRLRALVPPTTAGWKLVPVEPTPEMLKAAKDSTWIGGHYSSMAYRAMLAAAPEAPAHQGATHVHEAVQAERSVGDASAQVQRPQQAQAVSRVDAVAAHEKTDAPIADARNETALVGQVVRPEPAVLSAAHLRRLVAENEAQAALLRQAVYALSYHQDQTRPIFNTQQAIAAIRQHLEGKS